MVLRPYYIRVDVYMFREYIFNILREYGELSHSPNVQNYDILSKKIDQIILQISEMNIDNIILSNDKYKDPKCISALRGQVFSQNNEDGIISEIFQRIGTDSKKFVEIGAGDGIENTTRLLLETGWSGIWLEAGDSEIGSIRNVVRDSLEKKDIILIDKKINLENINQVLVSKIDFDPDYISIDIDYNTSHVWRSLLYLKPRLFCIEYNAHYPPSVNYEVPYKADGRWTGTTRFGASLKALEIIGREYGYSLVGCDIFGVNAFFVRNDLCDEDKFLGPFTAENHYEPPRFQSVHMRGHARHLEY
jgi:hypothetical protein